MVNERYDLDMTPDTGEPLVINVSQYDNDSREFTLTLYANGVPYAVPSGSLVMVQGTKEDHTGFQYPCTYDGAEVTFPIKAQMCVFAGRQLAEIVITKGDDVLGSFNFIFAVEPAALRDDTVISDTDLPILENLPTYASDAEAYAAGTRSGVPVSQDDPAYHNNGRYYSESASDSAGDAADSATAAAGSATAAAGSATSAAASATAAGASETAAGASASSAGSSASAAAASASDAAQSATAAAGSATAAAASASAAATSETNAGTSATGAAASATSAAADAQYVNTALGGLTFGQDAQGNWGYKIGGADPVIPFSSGGSGVGAHAFIMWRTNATTLAERAPHYWQTDTSGAITVSSTGKVTFQRDMFVNLYYYTSSSRGTSGGNITATMELNGGQITNVANNAPSVIQRTSLDFLEQDTITVKTKSSNTNTYIIAVLFIAEVEEMV